MLLKNIFMVAAVLAVGCMILAPTFAFAEAIDPGHLLGETGKEAGFNEGGTGEDALITLIARIINVLLSVLGVIFFVLVVYGGFLWMTSQGNEDRVKKAKTILTDSVIGLVILLAAYAISRFVIEALISATMTP
jgi:hypothetical protein